MRFIDDAQDRIREDYLRILRFFRFHAWYGDPGGRARRRGAGGDCRALRWIRDAFARAGRGRDRKSCWPRPTRHRASRRWSRPACSPGFCPGPTRVRCRCWCITKQALGVAPDPMRRLACLGGDDHMDRLRLSKADARHLGAAARHTAARCAGRRELGYRLGAEEGRDVALLNAALLRNPAARRTGSGAGKGARPRASRCTARPDAGLRGPRARRPAGRARRRAGSRRASP